MQQLTRLGVPEGQMAGVRVVHGRRRDAVLLSDVHHTQQLQSGRSYEDTNTKDE